MERKYIPTVIHYANSNDGYLCGNKKSEGSWKNEYLLDSVAFKLPHCPSCVEVFNECRMNTEDEVIHPPIIETDKVLNLDEPIVAQLQKMINSPKPIYVVDYRDRGKSE